MPTAVSRVGDSKSQMIEGVEVLIAQKIDRSPMTTVTACGSTSLFEVDVVNELVEMLKQTGAEADFADPIDTLTEAGRIGALLRY